MLEDLAVLTGGQVVARGLGLKLDQVGLEVLGTARRVDRHQGRHHDRRRRRHHDDVADRVAQIRAEIERTDSDWDREKLQERLAKLAGGVCVIKVGAATEVELKERKHRIEDAISATRAAVEEGIVAGGGSALVHAAAAHRRASSLDGDEATGVAHRPEGRRRAAALDRRERRPRGLCRRRQGARTSSAVRASTPPPASTSTSIAAGVIDPVKVTRSALRNAASIAAMVLTTDTLVVEKKEEEPEAAGGHGHGHGH